uniref:Peptide PGLa-R5 n=1 Tax=Xenopus ruwenzoriensis TaxID=105430 RepID=PGLR5_XENRU|nr:RecName: Full=Peptide PGLa-R5 [Xenopus ruwenzoriensis]
GMASTAGSVLGKLAKVAIGAL